MVVITLFLTISSVNVGANIVKGDFLFFAIHLMVVGTWFFNVWTEIKSERLAEVELEQVLQAMEDVTIEEVK